MFNTQGQLLIKLSDRIRSQHVVHLFPDSFKFIMERARLLFGTTFQSQSTSGEKQVSINSIYNICQCVPSCIFPEKKTTMWAFCRFNQALSTKVLKNLRYKMFRGGNAFGDLFNPDFTSMLCLLSNKNQGPNRIFTCF